MRKNPVPKTSLSLALIFGIVVLFGSCQNDPANQPATPQERLEELSVTYDSEFQDYLASAQQTMGKTILTYGPLAPGLAIPKRVEIQGSHYEYGYLVALMARQYGRQPLRINTSSVDLNNRIIDMYREVYPPFLEIARGIGDVFDITVEELDFIHLEEDFFAGFWWNVLKYSEFQSAQGANTPANTEGWNDCALVSARLQGNTIVGRNFDNDHVKPHFVVVSRMDGAYKVLANASYKMYHWVMDGINEKGLVMGTAANVEPPNYFWRDPYPSVPAIQQNHLFRIALETCATVDEVISLYSSVRPWSPSSTGHLLVVDARGNSAVIEFDLDRQPHFFRADKEYQVLTNTAYHMGFDYMMDNCWRFRRATEMAEAGLYNAVDVLEIMLTIRGTHGYTSLFDINRRWMQVHFLTDPTTPYEFLLNE